MKIILYIFLFVLATSTSFTQWIQLSNGLGSERIYSLAVNGNNVLAGTEGKGVYLSKDLGNNWESIGLSPQNIGSVAFSGNTILAGTEGTGVFITSDNGKTWSNPLPFDMIYCITFGNNRVFAGAFTGLYFSTDSGSNWTKSNKLNSTIGNIVTIGKIVIASTVVGIYKSTDNGDNWVKSSNGLDEGEYFALAISNNNLYTSSGGKVFLSTDEGNSWTKQTDLKADMIFTLAASSNNIFAGTIRENVFLSTDNGSNWVKKDNGLTGRTVKSLAISGDNIFAGTDVGVFKAKISDLISTTDVAEDLENCKPFLISPNPASNSIEISVANNELTFLNSTDALEIYNTLGEIVIPESIKIISGSVRLNIESFPAGLYFVKIGNYFEKLVKL